MDRGMMIGTMIIIVKVIYKMIPHVILRFSFDGDHRKIDVNNKKGIPQMQKTMEIRVPVQVTDVKMMFKFIMSRGSGVSLRKCNIVGDVEVSCVRQRLK